MAAAVTLPAAADGSRSDRDHRDDRRGRDRGLRAMTGEEARDKTVAKELALADAERDRPSATG